MRRTSSSPCARPRAMRSCASKAWPRPRSVQAPPSPRLRWPTRSRSAPPSYSWPPARCRPSSPARPRLAGGGRRSSSRPHIGNTRAERRELSPPDLERLSFVGVTTGQSAATRLFPAWARELGLGDVRLVGRDLPLHAARERYREVVLRIRSDPNERGGLVTTHKIDLFSACRDLFDSVDKYAEL